MANAVLRGFPPIIDQRIRTLILGSFPSAVSLRKKQYYGHPQNQFWRLVGQVIGKPLHELPYEQRLSMLLAHRIGLWDVIGQCKRRGSLDSDIRNAQQNQFKRITGVAKHLRRVCFNGKTAGKMEPLFAAGGFETIVLPSSSPAYTMRFEAKLKQWRQIVVTKRAASFDPQDGGSVASRLTPYASRRKC